VPKNLPSSSSSKKLRSLGLFLLPGNHSLSRLWSSYISSPFRFIIFFLIVCRHPFFVYVPSNLFHIELILSLISKIPNCSLMSLLLFLSQSSYPAIGLKNLISAASISLLSDRFSAIHQNRDCHHLTKFNLS
jgi:hypothetical protein